MRVLGLDVGERRIGVALSDSLGLTAQPLMVLTRTGRLNDLSALQALVSEHTVETIVIGLPLTLQGEQGPQARKVLTFVESLRRSIAVPVQLVDERLTTVQGQRSLREANTPRHKRKEVIDQVAAQLILQQYLDLQR